MPDNPVFDVPKCKVKYVKSCNASTSTLFTPHGAYTGPRYQVELVVDNTTYLAGEYPVAEFSSAITTAHRIAKRAQIYRCNNAATLITAKLRTKE